MPFKRSDKKVKNRMLSVPDKLRTAAMELLARVRIGLDIPSRAEVLDLAARIEAISAQMSRLEVSRAADSKLVDELRQSAQDNGRTLQQSSEGDPKRRADRKPRRAKTASAKSAPAKSGAKKKPAAGTAGSDRKPRSRNAAAAAKDADK